MTTHTGAAAGTVRIMRLSADRVDRAGWQPWGLNARDRSVSHEPGRCSVAGLAIWPGGVVDCEPWFAGHGRGGGSGERHDVAMQVGLIGIAAVGRNSGWVFARGQAVGGVVEADQLRSVFGW